MKKIIIAIVVIIVIILIVASWIRLTTPKYSHSNIVALINKGIQTLNNADNVSYDVETKDETVSYYFKGEKKKMTSTNSNTVFLTLEDEKTYMIDKEKKVISRTSSSLLSDKDIFQSNSLFIETLNQKASTEEQFRYEFVYVRDEKLDNKDCILVKESIFDKETKTYNDYDHYSENQTIAYWIEKSTGFVIGATFMESGKNTAAPGTIIKNIKFGEVTDDMLELPNDYLVL